VRDFKWHLASAKSSNLEGGAPVGVDGSRGWSADVWCCTQSRQNQVRVREESETRVALAVTLAPGNKWVIGFGIIGTSIAKREWSTELRELRAQPMSHSPDLLRCDHKRCIVLAFGLNYLENWKPCNISPRIGSTRSLVALARSVSMPVSVAPFRP
jgi:hypothetical protein